MCPPLLRRACIAFVSGLVSPGSTLGSILLQAVVLVGTLCFLCSSSPASGGFGSSGFGDEPMGTPQLKQLCGKHMYAAAYARVWSCWVAKKLCLYSSGPSGGCGGDGGSGSSRGQPMHAEVDGLQPQPPVETPHMSS